jgi:hypothetical protein
MAVAKTLPQSTIVHSASRTLAPPRKELKLAQAKSKTKADKDGDWKEF